jgi:putative acetyltransferase
MSAEANPKLALRPYLPADALLLAEIFRASIAELTAEDYSEAQRVVWSAVADDEAAFGARLAQELTLVATLGGSVVGFVSLKGADQVDLLYVHPAVAGQGIGAMLCDAVERLAAARGTPRLVVDASDSARGFFERRGYVAQQRNTVLRGDEWLANTTMEKKLTPTGTRAPTQ